jgi:hypothetical protein
MTSALCIDSIDGQFRLKYIKSAEISLIVQMYRWHTEILVKHSEIGKIICQPSFSLNPPI